MFGAIVGGPALAYGDGKLFLGWKDQYTNQIQVLVSSGDDFDLNRRTVVSEMSRFSPLGLFFDDHKLYLYFLANDTGRITILQSTDYGATFGNRTDLGQVSLSLPALAALTASGRSTADFYCFYADPITDVGPLKLLLSHDSNLSGFTRRFDLTPDQSPRALSAATFRGQVYLAWTGSFPTNHANVARYATGELLSYGLLPN
ncbi:MAG: hypothetical protein QM756_06760 [Polyangiaceae bacterium]